MTDTDDLLQRLRALTRCEHSDLSIGDEAADEIVLMRAEARKLCALRDEYKQSAIELRKTATAEYERATRAESELAALRGRIAAAPVVCIDNGACVTDGARLTIAGGDTYFAHAELCGKRVRLVVDEG